MAEYVDYAEYYDWDHNTAVDIPFYLSHARECGSPILELACGTGRVLIPLAEASFEVHGVDFSEKMLAVCRRKVEERELGDRVNLHHMDIASFELPRHGLSLCYIPVRSFMHLFRQDQQLACLQRAFDHLRPGGRFIVDVYAPDPRRLAQEAEGPFVYRKAYHLPNGHRVVRQDRFVRHDIVGQIMYTQVRFEEYDEAGELVRQRTIPLDTRYTYRYELQLLLERVGFQPLEWLGGYDGQAYDGKGEIIAVARRP